MGSYDYHRHMDADLEKIKDNCHQKAKKHDGCNGHPNVKGFSEFVFKKALHKWVRQGRIGDINIIVDQELNNWAKAWKHQGIHQKNKGDKK